MTKKLLFKIAIPLCIGLACFAVAFFDLFSGLDYFAKDILYNNRRPVSPEIKIIAIDEKAIAALGPFGTWDRGVYARIVNILDENNDARPAVIAFDVLFTGRMGSQGDEAFAKAVKESGNVVCASHLVMEEQALYSDGTFSVRETASSLELPYWLDANDGTTGFSNAALQPDGTVRAALTRARYDGFELNSFAYQTYLNFCAATGRTPGTARDAFLIDYAGASGDYEAVSLADVLDGKIDPAVFKGCAVLVGAYATGLQDDFYVSTNRKAPLYGVEIHANILQNLLEGRQTLPANDLAAALCAALLAAAFHCLARNRKLLFSTLLALGLIASWLLAVLLLFRAGRVMPVLSLPLFILLLYAYKYLGLYIAERIHRTRLSGAFKKYVAPQVFDQLAKDTRFEIKLGGELRQIAVLFIDIRGFTPLSESLEPQTVVSILNEYFALVTKAIFDNGGTLDKFIGDAAMAVFNAPFDLPDYEYRAVRAALDIVSGAAELERRLSEQYGKSVGFGIGVHCGEAVVGNIGCDFRMDYTAIGDTVNTAARLESNAKKGQILISDQLYQKVKGRIEAQAIGMIPLKGKTEGVFVYNATGKQG